MCFWQRGQRTGSSQGSFVLHWPEPTAQQYCHRGGAWRKKPTGKYKSLWVREEVRVSVLLCHKEPRKILPTWKGHSPHPWDSETETKLKWSLQGCVSSSCASHGGCMDCMCSSWKWLGLSLCSHSKSLLPLKKELLLILMDYHVAILIILPKYLLTLSRQVLKNKKKSLEEAMLHSQEPILWTRSFCLSHTCWDLLSQESWVLHSTGFTFGEK